MTRAERYAETAVDRELEELANTQSGRNGALNKAAFALGGFVAAGALGEDDAVRRLEAACEANGYRSSDGRAQVRATIKSGLRKGMESPRELPREEQHKSEPYKARHAEEQCEKRPASAEAPRTRQTLDEFAAERQLPAEALRFMGWSQTPRGIAITYKQRDGSPARTQFRDPAWCANRFAWDPDQKDLPIVAYEPDGGALARETGTLIVCEGTSDAATAHYAGLPALGIPGSSMARKVIDAHHLEGVSRVFVCIDTNELGQPDAGGEKFRVDVPRRLEELGFKGHVVELRMPDCAKDMSGLWVRDPGAFKGKLTESMRRASEPKPHPGFAWVDTVDIFEPLPSTKWIVGGLQLCPGRPAMLAGYGASAKTLSVQALALAVASGTPAWGHFSTTQGVVRHLDYEQGGHATKRRYQRLALGHGIDPRSLGDRLKLAVFPSVYLDSHDAVDAYTSICEGVDLVVLDALRGATPSHDENDSKIRACLDNLARISEKTCTAFLVLHHAGKPKDGHEDARTILRGSSAIFDALGSVYVLTIGKTNSDPRTVRHVKSPAEAEGGLVEAFALRIEDVQLDGNPAAGVRVVHAPVGTENPVAKATADFDKRASALLDFVRNHPGESQNSILQKCGMGRSTAKGVLDALEESGRLATFEGTRGAKLYRVAT